MDLKVKIVEDPNRTCGTAKLQAVKIAKEQLGLSLKEAKDIVEGQAFFIHEGELSHLCKLLRACGYILDIRDRDLKRASVKEQVKQDHDPSNSINKTTVNLIKDGQVGVVSNHQIEEETYSLLYNNVDMISTMLKERFPSISVFVGDRMDSNNNPTHCCCIALNVEGKYNTVEDINELAKFANLIQASVQSIVQIILKISNLYKDFERTFPKQ